MMDLLEDFERLPPQFASLVHVTGRLVGVTEINQHLGAVAHSAAFGEYRCRLPVAADCCLVLAGQVPHVAEAVRGRGDDRPVADLLSESQGLLAAGEAAGGVAQPGFEPADGVERGGQARPLLLQKLEQFAGAVRVAERSFAVVHVMEQAGEVQMGMSLAIDVLQFGELIKGTLQVHVGVVVSTEPREGAAEAALGAGLRFAMARPLSGRQRDGALYAARSSQQADWSSTPVSVTASWHA